MTPEIQQSIIDKVKAQFGDALISVDNPYDFPTLIVKKDSIVAVIRFLHDDEELRFRFLTTMCGLHFPEQKEELGMMYQLHSLENNLRIRLKCFFTRDNAVLPTLTFLFRAANWMEREAFDFFGIEFKGHPKLKRILNVEDMIMHPLLKEFPLEDQTRIDKNDTMFGR
jgi:NADH-quinone oxidoreductase subunit C